MDSSNAMVYGLNAVSELLQSGGIERISSILFQKNIQNKRVQKLIDEVRQHRIRLRFVDRVKLDKMTRNGAHQGVVARVDPKRQQSWHQFLDDLSDRVDPLVLLLDGVEDPRNLGAIMRSAEAFGVMAIIQPKDRAAPLSAVAIKAASGAADRLDLIRVPNLARAIQTLQDYGFQVIGLAGESTTTIGQADLKGPIALVMGHEGKGLRRLTRERCDQLVSIPMQNQVASLNVSTATAVALYEAQRQRLNSTVDNEMETA